MPSPDGRHLAFLGHKPEMFFSGNLGGGFAGGNIDLKTFCEIVAAQ